jgi:hypothetical protein
MQDDSIQRRREANLKRNRELLQSLEIDASAVPAKVKVAKMKASARERATEPLRVQLRSRADGAVSSPLATPVAEPVQLLPQRVTEDFSIAAKRYVLFEDDADIYSESQKKICSDMQRIHAAAPPDESALSKLRWLLRSESFKLVPERVFSVTFLHTEKRIFVAGDAQGHIGFLAVDGLNDVSPLIVSAHSRKVTSLFSPSDAPNMLYSSSYDGIVRGFDATTESFSGAYVADDEENLTCIDGLPSGRRLFAASGDGNVIGIDPRSCGSDYVVQGLPKKIASLSLSPLSPDLLATSGNDSAVRLWDVRSTKKPMLVLPHGLAVTSVSFSSDGRLVSTSNDNTICIWSSLPKSPKVVKISHNNKTGPWVTTFNAFLWGDEIVVGSMNRAIEFFDAKSGIAKRRIQGPEITAIPSQVAVHRSSTLIAAATV